MDIDMELLLKFLNDLNEEGIHVIDCYGRTLVYNDTMASFEGLDVDVVLDKYLLDVFPSLEGKSTLLQVMKTGEPIINQLQTYFNKDGKRISTLNSTWPVRQDGEIVGAIEVARDISKVRELTEAIVKLQEELLSKKTNTKKQTQKYNIDDIIGQSKQIIDAKKLALMASKTSSNVLIMGESGTGKELFGQSIHYASDRQNKPFIAENCAALPESLLEGLLFGTAKGGFTGAIDRPGLFQQADGGTLMLDEINSMPLSLQAKLLRAIQEGSFRTIGGNKEINVDVRIIAVTNEDPLKLIKEGKLREDLFYRLSVVNLFIPPLRERKDDIDVLVSYFINNLEKELGKKIGGISTELREFFYRYTWPGNVRELQHVIEGAINLIDDGKTIGVEHLPYYMNNNIKENGIRRINIEGNMIQEMEKNNISLDEYLKNVEEDLINKALKLTHGNISKAASVLGVTRQGLQYKIKKKIFEAIINE